MRLQSHPNPILGPITPGFGSRRSRPYQVDYWEGAPQLKNNKLRLKMIDHGSRSTWDPGPSRSRFRAQKHDMPPLKQDWLTTCVFETFLPGCTIEAVDAPQNLFRGPLILG